MSIRTVARGPSRLLAATVSAVTIAATVAVAGLSSTAAAADPLLSQGKPATASSTENAGTPASAAVDGNTGTRWSTRVQRPAVDPGRPRRHRHHHPGRPHWEAAYAPAFQIQTVAADGTTWTTIYSTTTGTGGTQTLNVTGSGRYVRMYGTARPPGTATRCGSSRSSAPRRPRHRLRHRQRRAGQARHRLVDRERRHPGRRAAFDGNTGTRWSQRVQRPAVAPGRPRRDRDRLPGHAELGGRLRHGVPDPGRAGRDRPCTTIYSTTTGTGGTQTLDVTGTGRYVRMYGTARATRTATRCGSSPCSPPAAGTPTAARAAATSGPNVIVFDPSMSTATIQSQLDTVFAEQESNQFGTQRYALLFKPAPTTDQRPDRLLHLVIGLGQNPDDVNINGDVTVDAGWFDGNATQNFWRSAENLDRLPSAGTALGRRAGRAVPPDRRPRRPQPRPERLRLGQRRLHRRQPDRRHRRPVLAAAVVHPRQHHRRLDQRRLEHGVLRRVRAPRRRASRTRRTPRSPTTPVTREKPYLYVDAAGNYRVFVPSLRTNATGATWANGADPGHVDPADPVLRRQAGRHRPPPSTRRSPRA